jgi:hypothetical protein
MADHAPSSKRSRGPGGTGHHQAEEAPGPVVRFED